MDFDMNSMCFLKKPKLKLCFVCFTKKEACASSRTLMTLKITSEKSLINVVVIEILNMKALLSVKYPLKGIHHTVYIRNIEKNNK